MSKVEIAGPCPPDPYGTKELLHMLGHPEPSELGRAVVRNRPTPEGRELGQNMAKLCDEVEPKADEIKPEPRVMMRGGVFVGRSME